MTKPEHNCTRGARWLVIMHARRQINYDVILVSKLSTSTCEVVATLGLEDVAVQALLLPFPWSWGAYSFHLRAGWRGV